MLNLKFIKESEIDPLTYVLGDTESISSKDYTFYKLGEFKNVLIKNDTGATIQFDGRLMSLSPKLRISLRMFSNLHRIVGINNELTHRIPEIARVIKDTFGAELGWTNGERILTSVEFVGLQFLASLLIGLIMSHFD